MANQHVDPDSGNDANSGVDWANAKEHPQAAVDALASSPRSAKRSSISRPTPRIPFPAKSTCAASCPGATTTRR
ncbi:MAG: hypothetical protein M5R36_29490 [Deltaproteobacteria bacterium]|nr:hypothetical protein [Deltaproteobacteria bacterium]